MLCWIYTVTGAFDLYGFYGTNNYSLITGGGGENMLLGGIFPLSHPLYETLALILLQDWLAAIGWIQEHACDIA